MAPNCTDMDHGQQNHEDAVLEDVEIDRDLDLLAQQSLNFTDEDICGIYDVQGRQSPALVLETMSPEAINEQLNVNFTENPLLPKYLNHSDRLKTYGNWPSESRHSPEALSEAGFFCISKGDGAACFHCGGVLHHWEPTDDPWIEHCLWFPNCKFVLNIKGQKFIDSARKWKHEGLTRTQEEIQAAIKTFKEFVGKDVNKVNSEEKENDTSSEGTSGYESEPSSSQEIRATDRKADAVSKMTCLLCFDSDRDTIFLPCYHMVACQNCASKLTKCCFCREPVIYRRRVFVPLVKFC